MPKLIDIDGVMHIEGDPVMGEGGKVLHQMVRPATDEEMESFNPDPPPDEPYPGTEPEEEEEEGEEPETPPADPPSDPPKDPLF